MRRSSLSLLLLALVATTLAGTAPPASAASPCDALADPVYQVSKPEGAPTLLTAWRTEVDEAVARHGYTTDSGVVFKASTRPADGLVALHRLHNPGSGDFVWLPEGSELDRAVAELGYVDGGTTFHVAPAGAGCGTPVVRFLKGSRHQYAMSAAAQDALTAAGWTREGVTFHAVAPDAPADVDTVFSLAAIPDTQNETNHPADTRFKNRMQWLVDNRASLDLRYVLHSGDVTNWGWLEARQYQIASDAFAVLDTAGIGYQAAIGNHDTRAVGFNGDKQNPGPGGAAYQDHPDCPTVLGADQCDSTILVRHTQEWNATFPPSRFAGVGGTFEAGKSDNMFQTFSAGGVDWLVLTLELYPRVEAVDWAKQVVVSHPRHNVIVVTHSYLTGGLGINQGHEYGATSPQYLYDNLVKVYPNVKMVFSGHVGAWGTRLDTGDHGNTIVSYLTALHSPDNPVRTLEIDTATGKVTTRLVTPSKQTTQTDATEVTLSFVR